MQQVSTKLKWGGLFAAVLALFVMAFALFTATPAQAAEGLTAGSTGLTAQADDSSSDAAFFTVYVQVGDNKKVAVKEYTKEELNAIAIKNGDTVSGLYNKGGWCVCTAAEYVTLDDLAADAGVPWASGASVSYGYYNEKQKKDVSYTFSYEDMSELFFYPNTTIDKTDSSNPVAAPLVIGTKTWNGAIGDDQKASDTEKAWVAKGTDDYAPHIVLGSYEADYLAKSGDTVMGARHCKNQDYITFVYDADATVTMYRLYNPYSGEHLYTSDENEYKELPSLGWKAEGTAWTAPIYSSSTVYRLYNPYSGDHHYTTDANEYAELQKIGWNGEGVGFYSDDAKTVKVFRMFNPYETVGTHHYTLDENEAKTMESNSWKAEGIGWYAVK